MTAATGMTAVSALPGAATESKTQESWVPMIAIALGQMIMSFNVASLPVALGRHGGKLRRSADDHRNRHRGVFDAGCRLRHARREAHPALRRGTRVPRRRCFVLRLTGADDIQPHCDNL